ncbi:DUF6226 family protein [Nocardioides iriomotensis]|uniref:Uncharacterized protein n=1 Tax=Nocardioides iriomotensis TaxID=715784 RepID=A0A4Q5IWU3_9ACTN|nr:DUF6226 family protein [Nocardioides iriomotensis]RYU10443.1 hypothetical protein ETU37_16890 [Nocardioides iriomotensis]
MTDVRKELARDLEEQFAVVRTHADWPDPWPDRQVPDEAYSRVTEPERWLIGRDRGEAWARALVTVGLAARSDEAEGIRLVPGAPGALTMLLVPHPAALEVRAGDPPVAALEVDCYCDACDSGSSDFLREIDDAVWHVIEGGFVRIDLGGAAITTHRDGWSSSGVLGHGETERLIADARVGRSRYPVVSGTAWW